MWLVEQNILAKLRKVEAANILPTSEQQAQFEARSGRDENGQPLIMSVAGGVAQINIKGLLTKNPDWLAEWFGGGNTTYSDIIAALAMAESDDNIKEVVLNVDSGGGQISGLFDAIAALQAFKKPLTAFVDTLAASAAYGLISQADKITASNRATQFGSIGIAATFAFDSELEEITITSTEAPDKRPDVRTPEGQAVIREHLDAIHELFVEAIAEGRGTTIESVNTTFGRGAVLLAEDAMYRGMVDNIKGAPALKVVDSSAKKEPAALTGEKKESAMTLKEMQAQHPDIYQAAVEAGIQQERDRVLAHLTMAEASGDTKTASEAIKSGDGMTASLQAKYLAAGMNKAAIEDRDHDEPKVKPASASEAASQVADLVEAKLGIGLEA